MTVRAPALFVGHGSPMNAIENTPSARGRAEIARAVQRPRAVVISAHWVTEGVRVTPNVGAPGDGETSYVFDKRFDPGISMTALAYGLPQ